MEFGAFEDSLSGSVFLSSQDIDFSGLLTDSEGVLGLLAKLPTEQLPSMRDFGIEVFQSRSGSGSSGNQQHFSQRRYVQVSNTHTIWPHSLTQSIPKRYPAKFGSIRGCKVDHLP